VEKAKYLQEEFPTKERRKSRQGAAKERIKPMVQKLSRGKSTLSISKINV